MQVEKPLYNKLNLIQCGGFMSGHSKFANIAHKKAANDAAKGKIFTRLGKETAN